MKTIFYIFLVIVITASLFIIKTEYDYHERVLKSFHSIEVSLSISNKTIDKYNKFELGFIEALALNRPDEVESYYKQASEVMHVSKKFVEYIDSLKKTLITNGGGFKEPIINEIRRDTELLNANNVEIHSNYFFKNPDESKAKELTNKVNQTRKKLLNLLKNTETVKFDPRDTFEISNKPYLLTTYDTEKYSSWAEQNFMNSSLAEVIAKFTKLQNDALNLEANIIGAIGSYVNFSYTRFR